MIEINQKRNKKDNIKEISVSIEEFPCWKDAETVCPRGFKGRFLQRIVRCVTECPEFAKVASQNNLSPMEFLNQLLIQYDELIIKTLQDTNRMLKRKVNELSVFLDIATAMQGTLELEEILYIILTGATVGYGLGFNRAILFLIDDTGTRLIGKLGVGPDSGEEAARIWHDLEETKPSLERIISKESIMASRNSKLNKIAKQMQIPLSPDVGGVIALTALEKKPFVITNAHNDPRVPAQIISLLGSNSFATAPLLAKDKVVGILWVDNLYTGEPITEEDIQSLMRFASIAGLAIERAQLYQRCELFNEQLENEVKRIAEELRKTEKELARQEKLAELGEMASGVAHELRNPLTAIRGFAQRMYRQFPESDKNKQYCAIIIKEVDRMNKIIKDVLDFARKPKPVFQKADINAVIKECLILMKDEISSKGIVVCPTFGDIPPFLFDPIQIRQVISNLISNAVQAMSSGGALGITTYLQDNYVKIEVQDTGVGISPEILNDIFHPFFTTKSGGTGLGLALAYEIIEDHKGKIEVKSKLGEGSTFIVSLPFKVEDSPISHEPNA